jgi:hypothetical protein
VGSTPTRSTNFGLIVYRFRTVPFQGTEAGSTPAEVTTTILEGCWNGRQSGLRSRCRKACGFESHSLHQPTLRDFRAQSLETSIGKKTALEKKCGHFFAFLHG